MYEITIKGNTPAELFANLAQMAAANMNAAPAAVPQPPVTPAPTANPAQAQPPVAAPAPVATAPSATPAPTSPTAFNPAPAPVAAPAPTAAPPVAPAPAAVPPAAPTYTLDALARAGATLAQSGKMEAALALLARYGVQTVNQLKPEQYGAFATELRALGAQI